MLFERTVPPPPPQRTRLLHSGKREKKEKIKTMRKERKEAIISVYVDIGRVWSEFQQLQKA
jgi:hypothetical protein